MLAHKSVLEAVYSYVKGLAGVLWQGAGVGVGVVVGNRSLDSSTRGC